jgi:hypothetical protein
MVSGQYDLSTQKISNIIKGPNKVYHCRSLLTETTEIRDKNNQRTLFDVFEDRSRTTPWRPGDNETTLPGAPSQPVPFTYTEVMVLMPHLGIEGFSDGDVSDADSEEAELEANPVLQLYVDAPSEPQNRIEADAEARRRIHSPGPQNPPPADPANPDPPLWADFGDQLLLYTAGQRLCLWGPNSIVTRYILTDVRPPENNEYFCTLEVLSLILLANLRSFHLCQWFSFARQVELLGFSEWFIILMKSVSI